MSISGNKYNFKLHKSVKFMLYFLFEDTHRRSSKARVQNSNIYLRT